MMWSDETKILIFGINSTIMFGGREMLTITPRTPSSTVKEDRNDFPASRRAMDEGHAYLWVWLWGFVSITIISLLSLLGVVLVPILKQSCFKFLLTFLVALAVGTLSGDALLHLLPHSPGAATTTASPSRPTERDYLN
ncbi:zinc transporter ZIP10-like [Notothenia coriiceps]|uniref:Zinc transporter ZIP10-like n=1 Tax=Notothenia coriiceps TaxID=8208 RepID=A0A6I9Q0K3_9TELE|nr:PREDICTED: zinc transporter ZIP10-like [Notothenia coriiceps]